MGAILQISANINRPDMGLFTKALHDRSVRVWNGAISAYIQAVANVVSSHQDTAMSYASLFATARKVKALGKIPPASPKRSDAQFSSGTQGGYASAWKNQLLGEMAGEKCSEIHYGKAHRPILTFSFEIAVYQYLMHEVGNFRPGIAWESLEAGRQAMNDYLNLYGNEMYPKFSEYFVPLTTKVY